MLVEDNVQQLPSLVGALLHLAQKLTVAYLL